MYNLKKYSIIKCSYLLPTKLACLYVFLIINYTLKNIIKKMLMHIINIFTHITNKIANILKDLNDHFFIFAI
jgi:hypothetical protein